MTTPRIAIATAAVLLCMGLVAARPAGAAPLLSVSYDVTGGTYGGTTGNTITGGRVVYTAPAGGISTPASCGAGGACGVLYVKLTGTTTLTFHTLPVTFAYIYPTTLLVKAFPVPGDQTRSFEIRYYGEYSSGSGSAFASPDHTFTIGNEVRVFAPTATPTATPTTTPTATPTATPIPTGKKVTLCHKGRSSLSVSVSSVPAHLAHGDALGECAGQSSQRGAR